MLNKQQFWMGLILAIFSGAITANAAKALPDGPPPQSPPKTDNFVPDDFVNFSSGTSAGGIGDSNGLNIFGSITIPPEMSTPTGASSGSGVSGDGNSVSGDGTITLADIADYYTKNIDRLLEEPAVGEVAQKPRRIVRRRSAVCPNPQISRSSERLDELINQSEQFIEQVDQIKPENSIW